MEPFAPKRSKLAALIFLFITNFVPLAGVLFFGWKLFPILFYYWLESLAIGMVNIMKMNAVGRAAGQGISRFSQMLFFTFHYGMFTLVHGVFLFVLFGPPSMPVNQLALAGVSPFISHLVSYYQNFIGKGEYQKTTLKNQLFAPYARVIAMHVTIIFGGILMQSYGTPAYALAILTVFKTAIDLVAHLGERRRYEIKPTSQ